MKARTMAIDNLRAVLIFLVVLGHVLEKIPFHYSDELYMQIYTFHMPAFVFLSGLCFKKKADGYGLFRKFVFPYIIFQILYLAEQSWETCTPLILQFSTPNWIMWYLFCMPFWYMLTSVLNLNKRSGLFSVFVSFAIALAAGYDTDIGLFFSLSRIICFYPFFLLGAYIKANYNEQLQDFLAPRPSLSLSLRHT